MRDPRVLVVNTGPMRYDGITRVIENAISNMDRSNIVVDVVAINTLDDTIKRQFTDMGCKVYQLTRNAGKALNYMRRLSKIVEGGGYDIVHIHCNSCTAAIELLAAYWGGAKVRITHCHNTRSRHNATHRILRPLFDRLCTDRFACSKEAGQWLYPNDEFIVWNNAVDTELFRFNAKDRADVRTQYGLEGKIAVGHVANFAEQKNHLFLFDVWREVIDRSDDYILFLIGNGRNRGKYEQRVRDLHLQDSVVFMGTVHNVHKYLSAMDLMVLPSLFEGLPCVVIEWQCSGLPSFIADTVTSDCKLTDLVSFVPLERRQWVESILSANPIGDRKQRSSMSIKEITDAGFSIKENAWKLKQYYRDAIRDP